VKEHDVITESLPTPVFGHDGEPCPGCGAPLAGDQRYCLHCGARRPEARLEFLDVLDADVRARAVPLPAPLAAAAPPPGLNGRLQAHSGALALGSVLLLTLIVGLLVGHWVTADRTVAASAPAAPQVIRVEGAGTAAAPAAAAGAGAAAGGAAAKTKAKATKKSSAATDAASTPKDAVSVKKLAGDKKAIDKAVKKGKPIATGGKPLPKDDKAPGGGSSFETIG
jgi:hypothetical protein